MSTLKAFILPVTPFAQNCTLLWNEENARGAVIDPGGESKKILATAFENKVTIEKVLITHGHMDHAGAAAAIAEQLNIPIEGPHTDDLFLIEKLAEQGARYGLNEARPFEPNRWLDDGDQVTVGGLDVDVIHCPGHTPGHVVFHHKDSNLAQVGDVIFQGSVGRSDFPRGNHDDLVNSIRNKLFPLGDDVTFIPGHGGASTFGWERKTNPFVCDFMFEEQGH